jgi:hypothetical protein
MFLYWPFTLVTFVLAVHLSDVICTGLFSSLFFAVLAVQLSDLCSFGPSFFLTFSVLAIQLCDVTGTDRSSKWLFYCNCCSQTDKWDCAFPITSSPEVVSSVWFLGAISYLRLCLWGLQKISLCVLVLFAGSWTSGGGL